MYGDEHRHDKCGYPIRNGKCLSCDLHEEKNFPLEMVLHPGDDGIHDKCGYPIRNGKCTHCD